MKPVKKIVPGALLPDASGESKLARELERIHQRLQASRKTLHQSEMKVEDLDALIHATREASEARKLKRAK